MKKDKKTHQIHILLNDAELEIFKKKAKNYHQLSSMIRDAVVQFNDRAATESFDQLNNLSELIRTFGVEMSKQGGNLNQAVKRANELIYSGELNQDYYDKVLLPIVEKNQNLIFEIKTQQAKILNKLIKLT
jgi:hypothetical protein